MLPLLSYPHDKPDDGAMVPAAPVDDFYYQPEAGYYYYPAGEYYCEEPADDDQE